MKKIFSVMFFCLIFVGANAQDQQDPMKAWMDYATPGPMHKMFEKMSGNWKTVMTMTDQASGQEMKSEGSAVFEMILGGRYMKSVHKSTMMGMPFEGMGLDAYDNKTGEFISMWVDNMGTGLMVMKGKFDEPAKTFHYTGAMVDPVAGGETKVRSVLKVVDENNSVFEMFTLAPDGNEYKMFTMTYQRAQ